MTLESQASEAASVEPWSWAAGTCTQEAQRMDAGGSKWRSESSGHSWETQAMVRVRHGGPERIGGC